MKAETYQGKKVLVTGASGMLGRPLVKMLVDNGADVTACSYKRKAQFDHVCNIHADLVSLSECTDICQGMDYVFHFGGMTTGIGVEASDAASFFVINSTMNLNMLEASRINKVQRYLFGSTIHVMHSDDSSSDVFRISSNFKAKFGTWAKKIGEFQCQSYKEQFGMKIAILRFASVYGPYDNFNEHNGTVVASLIKKICSGDSPVEVWGNGQNTRSFVYADDCALASLYALDSESSCDANPIIIASQNQNSVKELVEIICRQAGRDPEIMWDYTKPSGISHTMVNTRDAVKRLGWLATTSIEDGIGKTVDWYLSYQDNIEK